MRFGPTAALSLLPSLAAAWMPLSEDGWELTWVDTFKGDAGGLPNTKHWDIMTDINTNNELQTYTTSNRNLQLSGGDTVQFVPWKSGDGAWSSARIESKASFTPREGKKMKLEAKIRLGEAAGDARTGLWPAFWAMGDSIHHGTEWPLCGEIDIFEMVSNDPKVYGTVHCDVAPGGVCDETNGIQGSLSTVPQDNDFHKWAVTIDRTNPDWTQQTLCWTVDGADFFTLSGGQLGDQHIWSTLAHSPLYMILNVAVGGDWPGSPSAATADGYENMMEVAYVSVSHTK